MIDRFLVRAVSIELGRLEAFGLLGFSLSFSLVAFAVDYIHLALAIVTISSGDLLLAD